MNKKFYRFTLEELLQMNYEQLYSWDVYYRGELSNYLNSEGYASKTVCPICRFDDFCHSEDCEHA